MKIKLLKILLFLALFLVPLNSFAYLGNNWSLSSFDTDITVRTDGSLLVEETIVADFTGDPHHGIFRTIPVVYRDKYSQSFKLRYKVLSVKDEKGYDWWYSQSTDGDYLRLQIGDADRLFDSPQTYVIIYEIQRAMSFAFTDHDELYWNATGEEWPIPIDSATATITYPEQISSADVMAECYTGGYKSREQACTYEVNGNMISYTATRNFSSYEGLTIVAGFPKGVIEPLSFSQQLIWTLEDNWGYFIPLVTFIILYYLWWTRGRDPQTNRDTVMPIYTPPEGLTPCEAGTLIDERADMHDLSATIIDLAVRGYLKINETKKKTWVFENTDYEFELLKDFQGDNSLKSHEKKMLEAIFSSGKSRKLSDLENKFYKDLPDIKTAIYSALVSDKYFPTDPDKVRGYYYGFGIGIITIIFFTFGLFIDYSIAIPVGIGMSGILLIIFAKYMPAKTKKGVEMYYQVLGLEMFIDTAEKDRLKWKEQENIFEKLLPYAMAFRLADKWSKAFEGLNKAPKWYSSTDPDFVNNFNTGYLIGRLNSLSNSMNSTFTSAPRSSGSGGAWSGGSGFGGGGFSGGGFGGGGGGGW